MNEAMVIVEEEDREVVDLYDGIDQTMES